MHENSTNDHPETMNLDVPGLIRRVRREADLSQRELAERAGVSQSTLARWEKGLGVPDVTTFGRLIALAGYALRVADAAGEPARPMTDDTPLDRQWRRFPAHLDVIDDVEPYTGRRIPCAPRRVHRDLRRRWEGSVPADHPTRGEIEAERARRNEALRARTAAVREAIRARRSAQGITPP